ncbi:MAG: NADH-quinone oxidoreductase subunit N [Chloroflexota bacterium]|nr:NADH-quinone oxidoreductase subunit N [Chloroflexota bacterium]MDQ5866030.1 NADH-quinone oxidoreductase subunit N [Chloroflexota bacterium]
MQIDYAGLNTDLWTILPELIVTITAILVIFADLFTRGRSSDKGRVLSGLSIAGYVAALVVCLLMFDNNSQYFLGFTLVPPGTESFGRMVVVDNLGLFFRMLALGTSIVAVLLSTQFIRDRGMALGEYYAVLALVTVGMMVTAGASDLTTIFVGIELSSIGVYILTGFNRRDKLSNEAAVKYFLLGIFSTAILVYGMAWLYGMTGFTNLRQIGGVVGAVEANAGIFSSGGLLLALFLLIAGLGFKIAAVPFHMWTPDAYQGAPTPVTAMMSVGPKAAGFAATIRIMIEAFGPAWETWAPTIAILSVLTMTLGNVVGTAQRSVKRMLAYSSIAHTGYMMIGLAAFTPQNQQQAISSVSFYLFSYLFMNMGAFGIVIWLQRQGVTDSLDSFRGLSTWAPGQAALMLFFLLSLTGIPPTIGFLGKYYVFVAALQSDLTWLAVVGALNSAIAAFYYLRIIWYMYFEEPRAAREHRASPTLTYTLVGAAIAVILFFIFSGPLIDAARVSLPQMVATLASGG